MRSYLWRLVEWRLKHRLSPRRLVPVLGDLADEFETRARSSGRLLAEWWLLRETWSLAAAYRAEARGDHASARAAVDRLRVDLWQAWRAVRARPAATLAMAAVLTIGIGFVSAMFALADPYLLRPLPYAQPQELVSIWLSAHALDGPPPTLVEWQARRDLFVRSAAYATFEALETRSGDRTTAVSVAPVSRDFLDVLGLAQAMPMAWSRRADAAETPIVLARDVSQRVFGTEDATGRLLQSASGDGQTYHVIGVLPATFLFPSPGVGRVGGLIPLGDAPLMRVRQSLSGQTVPDGSLRVLARVQPGVTPATIQAALSTAPASSTSDAAGVRVSADWLSSSMRERRRPLAAGALAAGVLILLGCAANIANLLLARGAFRTREFAARQALGATHVDLARLVMIELACLACAGVAGGLVLARTAITLIAAVIPAEYIALGAPAVTLRVVVFACAASSVAMLAGLAPAWAAWRVTPSDLFTKTSAAESRRVRALRYAMMTAQSAVAVVLLVGAAMLVRSYVNLLAQDTGFTVDTYAVRANYPRAHVGDRLRGDIAGTLDRLQRVPGVTHVAASSGTLVENISWGGAGGVTIGGRRVPGYARTKRVTVGFFETIGSQIVAGRLPTLADRYHTAVVSETLATACCAGASPVGSMLLNGSQALEIVGVVRDVYDNALDQRPPPTAFVPLETAATDYSVTYVLRLDHPDGALGAVVEREIAAVNRDATIGDGGTLGARLMQSIHDRSFATLMLTLFALAALLVSAAGLVGVVSFSVARRTREIAIRMAIGARPSHVRVLVAREAAMAAGTGALVGFTAGAWLSKALQSWLYGIRPADPLALVAAVVVMVAVVVTAAWMPARRALRLSPTLALRAE